jgi:hypothetical protein
VDSARPVHTVDNPVVLRCQWDHPITHAMGRPVGLWDHGLSDPSSRGKWDQLEKVSTVLMQAHAFEQKSEER